MGDPYLTREASGEKLCLWGQCADTSDIRVEFAPREVSLENLNAVWISFDL